MDRTIRSTVERHLFQPIGDQSSEDSEVTPCPTSPSVTLSARQRRRHQREQQQQEEGLRHRERNRLTESDTITALAFHGIIRKLYSQH